MIFWSTPPSLGLTLTDLPGEDVFLSPPPEAEVKRDPGTRLYRLALGKG